MRGRKVAPFLLVLALVACERPAPQNDLSHRPRASPTNPDALVIGLVATLSGRDSWRGEDAFEGADVGVQVLNRLRPEGAAHFELVTLDDRGDARRAAELAEELASSPRTIGVIYAGPPLGLPSAGAALAEAGIPALLCHGDLFSAGLLRNNLFQMTVPYTWQARELVSYATADRGYRRLGLLIPRGSEGSTAGRAMRAALRGRRARLTIGRFDAETGDLDAALVRLEAARVQGLVVDAAPPLLAEIFDRLRQGDHAYRTTRIARRAAAGPTGRPWRPQILSFDSAVAPADLGVRPFVGTVAADGYARGAGFMQVPSFIRFRSAFREWWGEDPLGWQRRSYDAVRLVGWAVEHSQDGPAGVAAALEKARGERFGGPDISFSENDHIAADLADVGLWVVPSPASGARSPKGLSWVPLARRFAIGARTHLPPEDWRFLFVGRPRAEGPPPSYRRFRYGVTSGPRDPVH